MKVVTPTIVRPWDRRIAGAETFADLHALRESLARYRVLDPACGSGNFLYVAYRELKAVERRLLRRMLDLDPARTAETLASVPFLSTRNFYGLDVLPFAVELAKVTLMLAKELSLLNPEGDDPEIAALVRDVESPLPLDNLDANIVCADALFAGWPEADAIIGNPPYQAKNKLLKELGAAKLADLRAAYPDVPGRADFCVYFFRRAHDVLKPGGRAGLVGTNTIRQNDSRVGGLDYIATHDGVILDAVSTQPWSGDAAVHVSIVNWAKRPESDHYLAPGVGAILPLPAETPLTDAEIEAPKALRWIEGEKSTGRENYLAVPLIGPALSAGVDVSAARSLRANSAARACYQGQTHGHEGFLLTDEEARALLKRDPSSAPVLFPYLTADEFLQVTTPEAWTPRRWVIDFGDADAVRITTYKAAYERVRALVLPDVQGRGRRRAGGDGQDGSPPTARATLVAALATARRASARARTDPPLRRVFPRHQTPDLRVCGFRGSPERCRYGLHPSRRFTPSASCNPGSIGTGSARVAPR